MRERERIRRYAGAASEWPYAGVLQKMGHADFPGERRSIPAARRWVRNLLVDRGMDTTLDDVLLLVSEVVTNSVVHSDSGRTADGRVAVYVAHASGVIHVEVTDDGSATSEPIVRMPKMDGGGGRGLLLVDLLATSWGAHHDPDVGGAVWFQVAWK
ncbi:ATP-binding protein [Streptosporangium sp. CA-135522]|uniref:ATP-binding protein n=1 Tax=Streptosporangium sp. CA-135522 TaxID=3240072 RepID=UPI003D93A95E